MLGNIFNIWMTPYPSKWYMHDHDLWSRLYSRYFHHVLILLSSPLFYDTYVQLPDENYPAPNKISSNSKLSPYFDNTQGATDGTQISCLPSSEEWENSHNCKGGITQNILACCSFDLRFQYFLSSADGASDLRVPLGRYHLADAGFAACDSLIIPYRWVHYYLVEWGCVRGSVVAQSLI
jgi:hypothetical protein